MMTPYSYNGPEDNTTSTMVHFLVNMLCLLSILSLSGCCNCTYGCGGRRPQVMATEAPCVIDYDFDCSCDCEDNQDEYYNLDNEAEAYNEESKPKEIDNQFRFSIGDFVDISVFGEDETSSESNIVAPDGCIYYSFLDAIPVVGRTIPEVSKEMEQKLTHLFINPIVTINLRQATDQNFKIYGRVLSPGVYPVVGNMTLREAIAEAGGFQKEAYQDKVRDSDLVPLADLKDSYVLRDGKRLDVDFNSLIYGPDNDSNIRIKPGDLIYIASAETLDIYVLGAVKSPLRVGYLEGMTLMQALGEADGWIYGSPFGADIHNVLIVRGPLECPCAMDVDLSLILSGQARDIELHPGDIIYVHNKTLRFGRVLVNIAINAFVQSFVTGAAAYYTQIEWFPVGK